MAEYEGLCDSDYFSRMRVGDHWNGTSRNHRKQVLAWNHVSPSQIESFTKCQRSWYFKSILKIPEIQKGHQALGESFHLVLEKVPKGLPWPNRADTIASPEEWDRADAMAKIALPLLPVEKNGITIKREWGIRLATYENGPTMVGYVDLGVPPGLGMPALLIPDNEAIVADYKTLSDFRYMKTPEELANSVQMMTYGKWAIEEWPSGLCGEHDVRPETIRLLHLYARTKAPFTRATIRHESAVVTPAQINTFWDKTLDTVREMASIANSGCSSDDVEAGGALNGHCEAYGGCSFRDKCGISKESGIKTLFNISKKPPTTETPTMAGPSLLDKIQAARAAAAGTPPATVPVVAPTPPVSAPVAEAVATKPAGPISGLMAKISAQGQGQPALGGAAAQAYGKETGSSAAGFSGTGELGKTMVNTVGDLLKLASGVIPQDAPPREQAVITQPGQVAPEVVDPVAPGEEDEEEETNTTPVPSDPSASPNTPIPSSEPAKKRGRPSREEMAAREAAEKKRFEDAVAAEVAKRSGQPVISYDAQERDQLWESERAKLQAELDSAKKDREIAESVAQRAIAEKNQLKAGGAAPQKEGCTLYVDCYPVKGSNEGLVDFFEWIQPIAAAVAQSNGVADYRLINYTAKGLLATAMRELIKAEGLPQGMTIPLYAAGADVALEILTPLAKRVIRKL